MLLKKLALLCSCVLAATSLHAQTVLTVQVNNADDDLEEWIAGPTQTKTVGALDVGSSDLEFGCEAVGGGDPQLVGIRFNNITIPKGALITRAYIQFTVDATAKNTDPVDVWIKTQASDNAPAFNTATPFDISSRTMIADSVNWLIPAGSWATVGAAGADQATADLKQLVQNIVDRNGWASGNSMVFTLKGTGVREAEAFDGSPTDAAKLVIHYIVPTTSTYQIAASDDDMEEWIAGATQTKTVGAMDPGSSDLELGTEAAANGDPQVVGLRFTTVNIPKKAYIKSAYLQFTVDATGKNTDPNDLVIKVQDADNPATFNSLVSFDVSSRNKVADSVTWTTPAGSWTTVGAAGADQRSTNIAKLLQKIVDRDGWNSGNSVAFFITGTGLREAESYDGSPADAPKLIVEYIPVTTVTYQVSAADDDLEEWIAGANQSQVVGALDAGSSDLEFGTEGGGNDPQMVGLRFGNVTVPKGAIVRDARIRFTVDATAKNSDPVNVWVKAQDADNPVTFNPAVAFDITSRAKMNDSVNWLVPTGSWATVGASGPDQTTTNISRLTQALVNRAGWASGNAMAYFIHGTGTREAESYDGSPSDAARLIIDYVGGPGGGGGGSVNPAVNYPLVEKNTWSYLDTGSAPANWKDLNFNDTVWASGKAPLGYNATNLLTTVGYGGDTANKHITTYYRKRVNVTSAAALPATLEFRLRADDGAVVYVNNTEALRVNLPTGTVSNTTLSSADMKAPGEDVYFTYDVPKTAFTDGLNIVAVEVHQSAKSSKDHAFDLAISNPNGTSNPTDIGCNATTDLHIGCFTSLLPRPQNDTFQIPSTHAYQFLAQTGDPLTIGTGTVKSNFDFTGYVAKNSTSSTEGWIDLNHERGNKTGGVSVFGVHFNAATGLWVVDSVGAVDFSTVAETQANCSGGVTPWETSITCEEDYPSTGDANGDGYIDFGWNVEVDPKTRKVKDYGNGPEKLWAMGRMSHENVVVHKDRKTVYFGEDDGLGALYKFVANTAGNLSAGSLYVLKLDQPLSGNEPTGTTGTWVSVPNTTKQERNDVKIFGSAMGSTFSGIEDVEIGTIDSQVYFTAKGFNRIYRFADNGTTVSGFQTYAGGKTYRVTSGTDVISEAWGSGNDNLAFDDRGNLWVLQDGGRNHVWVIRPGHTQANPKIEVFMHIPREAEPTGMTFTPDYKYMFISIQEPAPSITVPKTDVAGVTKTVNKSTMMVISRKEYLGVPQSVKEVAVLDRNVRIYPNPFTESATLEIDVMENQSKLHIEMIDIMGKTVQEINASKLDKGMYKYTIAGPATGFYFCNVTINGIRTTYKVVKR
ncbi:MAG TPA: alkaline phosphatase PhoX [Flavipsychrobacter sp.]